MHTDRRAHGQEVMMMMMMLRVVVVTFWLNVASAAEVSLTSASARASLSCVAFSDTGKYSGFYPPADSAVYNKTVVNYLISVTVQNFKLTLIHNKTVRSCEF